MKSKHTKGKWKFGQEDEERKVYNVLNKALTMKIIISGENARASAQLIAEAGTVANETGKTPRELAEANKELLEALIDSESTIKYLMDNPKTEISIASCTISLNKVIRLIQKHTK